MGYGDPLNSSSELHGRSSIDLLARMIYGEAEGESEKGKEDVHLLRKTENREILLNLVAVHGKVFFLKDLVDLHHLGHLNRISIRKLGKTA